MNIACQCAAEECRLYGCRSMRMMHPNYRPPFYQGIWPGHTYPVQPTQHGCICPPGAEKTCQGPMCPRRPLDQFRSAASAMPADPQ
jgi:hypothetical protein